MALNQGQRYVRVDIVRINYYLYTHVKIEREETVVEARIEGDEIIFLVEKTDAKED